MLVNSLILGFKTSQTNILFSYTISHITLSLMIHAAPTDKSTRQITVAAIDVPSSTTSYSANMTSTTSLMIQHMNQIDLIFILDLID